MKKFSNTEAEFKKSIAYKSMYLMRTRKHELNILIAYITCIYILFYSFKIYWSLTNFFLTTNSKKVQF